MTTTATTATCDWTGASGTRYTYYVYPLPANFNQNQAGNYIFAKKYSENRWVPIYIGQGDLNERANHHHKAYCIRSKGATHFHCHLNATEQGRRAEESDLLAKYLNAYEPSGCNERIGG